GGPGGNDVYVSTQQPDGSFGVAQLVDELSSSANDQRPVIRFDGLELFLWSDRPGSVGGTDLWVSSRERVSDPWGTPLNLGGTVNSIYDEAQPYIASDRSTLLFSSNRPGGVGGFDLYTTTHARRDARQSSPIPCPPDRPTSSTKQLTKAHSQTSKRRRTRRVSGADHTATTRAATPRPTRTS